MIQVRIYLGLPSIKTATRYKGPMTLKIAPKAIFGALFFDYSNCVARKSGPADNKFLFLKNNFCRHFSFCFLLWLMRWWKKSRNLEKMVCNKLNVAKNQFFHEFNRKVKKIDKENMLKILNIIIQLSSDNTLFISK